MKRGIPNSTVINVDVVALDLSVIRPAILYYVWLRFYKRDYLAFHDYPFHPDVKANIFTEHYPHISETEEVHIDGQVVRVISLSALVAHSILYCFEIYKHTLDPKHFATVEQFLAILTDEEKIQLSKSWDRHYRAGVLKETEEDLGWEDAWVKSLAWKKGNYSHNLIVDPYNKGLFISLCGGLFFGVLGIMFLILYELQLRTKF